MELVGLTEIAQRAGVLKSAVSNWDKRNVSFPEPMVRLHCGPIWNWADVESWLQRTGRRTDANLTAEQVSTNATVVARRKGKKRW